MDVIGVVESKFKAAIDQAAFEINVCIKDQSSNGVADRLHSAIKKYQSARLNLDFCQEIRNHLSQQAEGQSQPDTDTKADEN